MKNKSDADVLSDTILLCLENATDNPNREARSAPGPHPSHDHFESPQIV